MVASPLQPSHTSLMSTKTSFTFDPASLESLENLAKRRGVKKSEVIRRALMLYDFVTDDAHANQRPEVIVKTAKQDGSTTDRHVLVP